MSQKIKSSKRAADFDSDDEVAASKKTKAGSSKATIGDAQVGPEGNQYWEVDDTHTDWLQ